MNYGGKAVRGGQLFGEETKIAMTKKYFKGLQGVENIYTQHKPYLIDLLQVRHPELMIGVAKCCCSLLITEMNRELATYAPNGTVTNSYLCLRDARRHILMDIAQTYDIFEKFKD